MRDHRTRSVLVVSWCLLLLGYSRSLAEAAPTGPAMPWDGPLNVILASLSGTVAHAVITAGVVVTGLVFAFTEHGSGADRKSTRLNSSHLVISYAVFCLKKKKTRRPVGGRRRVNHA